MRKQILTYILVFFTSVSLATFVVSTQVSARSNTSTPASSSKSTSPKATTPKPTIAPKHKPTKQTDQYAPSQVIVKFKKPLVTSTPRSITKKNFSWQDLSARSIPISLKTAHRSNSLQSLQSVYKRQQSPHLNNLYLLTFKSGDSAAIAKSMSTYADIEYVTPNYRIEFFGEASSPFTEDPLFSEQWYLYGKDVQKRDISAVESFDLSVYNVTPKDTNIIVAIVDQALFYDHPDLKDRVWINTQEIPDDGIDNDNNGYIDDYKGCTFDYEYGHDCGIYASQPLTRQHGTHVAGVVAATHSNGEGINGVCPHCVIMRAGMREFAFSSIEAIIYAADNGADVINMSWGLISADETITTPVHEAIKYAAQKGAVLVAASGNFGSKYVHAPARFPEVIAVAGVTGQGEKANFSNFGPEIALSAFSGYNFGEYIITTSPRSEYLYSKESGTSFAAPMVAGAAGMLLSYSPDLKSQEVRDLLTSTTDPIVYTKPDWINNMGSGQLNMFRALYKSLDLKSVHTGYDVLSAQCYKNTTRLEIRNATPVTVDGKAALEVVPGVYSVWVQNGATVQISGKGFSMQFVVPHSCSAKPPNPGAF